MRFRPHPCFILIRLIRLSRSAELLPEGSEAGSVRHGTFLFFMRIGQSALSGFPQSSYFIIFILCSMPKINREPENQVCAKLFKLEKNLNLCYDFMRCEENFSARIYFFGRNNILCVNLIMMLLFWAEALADM